jgi:hypothetical protein
MIAKREAEGGKVMSDVATVAVVVAIVILTLVNVFIAVR